MSRQIRIAANVLCVFLLLSLLTVWQAAAAVEADKVLSLAEDVGRWVASTAVEHDTSSVWPDDALAPDKVGYDLASGVSGKVVFFVALYRATGNDQYLKFAKRGADFLISILDEPSQFDGDQRRASLYAGVAGIGVALLHVRAEAPEQKYITAVQTVVKLLDDWAISDDDGVHWSEKFNDLIYGDAGTALFLAHVALLDGDSNTKVLAKEGAHFLLSQAVDEGDGCYWLFRRDKEFNLPNFSHGTAGIAYVLATVGALSEDKDLLRSAEKGFAYVRSIAETKDDRLRIPYGWGSENWQGLYEFGWAHGLTGTSLMFMRMQQLEIDSQYAEDMLLLSRKTLVNIDLPGPPAAPFAEPSTPLDMRFGRAGVLSLAGYWAAKYRDDAEVIRLRDALLDHLEAAAIRDDDTAHWQVNVPAFMGGGQAAYTGIFHGAAGIGLALLDVHANLIQEPLYTDLPDNPL
jgi:hypothetical protein